MQTCSREVAQETSSRLLKFRAFCSQSFLVCADDQAESGLIRLARASGIDGLQGILPSRPFLSSGLGEVPTNCKLAQRFVWVKVPVKDPAGHKKYTYQMVCTGLPPLA